MVMARLSALCVGIWRKIITPLSRFRLGALLYARARVARAPANYWNGKLLPATAFSLLAPTLGRSARYGRAAGASTQLFPNLSRAQYA